MSGPAPWDDPPRGRASARARLRPKSQLTLPEEIRHALHVREGDEVEFTVHEDGTITVRGYVSIPADHARRYLPPRVPDGT
jgi:AbrB family looped-hinge helix DNA binding protein